MRPSNDDPSYEEFSEEILMAYADGELPAAQAQAIADAARSDAQLARRIERYAATRRVLAGAFAGKLEEPVPQRLLQTVLGDQRSPAAVPRPTQWGEGRASGGVRGAGAEGAPPVLQEASPKVVLLRRRAPTFWTSWQPLALAASVLLVVGLLSSRLLMQAPDLLSVALETQASGVPQQTADGEIVALSTLRTADGDFCREYERSRGGQSTRGLACRGDSGDWAERAVASAPAISSGSGYQTASGDASDAAAALKAQRLTAEEEKKLIQKHWR